MNGMITASTTMVKEREAGTLEQLLMTPARDLRDHRRQDRAAVRPAGDPGDRWRSLVIRLYFDVPFNGSVAAGRRVLGGLCLLCGIGIGTAVATITKSAQQAQLATFFIMPPMMSLSGAMTPAEAMPGWMRPWTVVNPVYHFGVISRGSDDQGQRLRRSVAAPARAARCLRSCWCRSACGASANN